MLTLILFIGLLILLFIMGIPVCVSIGLTCLAGHLATISSQEENDVQLSTLPVVPAEQRGFGGIPDYQQLGRERNSAAYRAAYHAEIRFLDAQLGAFFEAVRAYYAEHRDANATTRDFRTAAEAAAAAGVYVGHVAPWRRAWGVDMPRGRGNGVLLGALVAPHVANLSPLILAFFYSAMLWRLIAQRRPEIMPGRWLLLLLMIGALALVVFTTNVTDGRLGGTALLTVMLGLKLLELRERRDIHVTLFLGFFLVLTQFLYDQSMWLAAYLFGGVMALVSKKVARISSFSMPSARSRMVTGSFRRRSMRVKMQSLGSNSKSSQDPR